MKTANEIREEFLQFFKDKEHEIVPSTPVVPADDPTLLFINAGMNQFKNIFIGTEKSKYIRVVDTQKCIRVSGKHNDLEDVGVDTSHHTFFEMLGNWSFGDYYKKEAIEWAWELLTKIWGLDGERIWATVHDSDDEAKKLWTEVTPIKAEKVLMFGDKDNFWEMGDTGPCGPCSEIHYYIGEDINNQSADKINSDDPDYLEIWNLVFIQYNRNSKGEKKELPSKHVDTGMGLERVVSLIQGKKSNYDTDIFTPIIKKIESLTGKKYEGDDQVSFRVIADHLRSLSFSIADGVLPSNEGRGYVLRRLLRRAARFGRNLDMHSPFIYKLVSTLSDMMGNTFPELPENLKHIEKVIHSEEESFGETVDRGIEIFNQTLKKAKKENKSLISGEDAFKLYDTYGFPLDLTELMAREKGFSVDIDAFEKAMDVQRKRSRSGKKFSVDSLIPEGVEIKVEATQFLGYETLEADSEITQIITNKNKSISLLLKATPYYAESGGQIGDTGLLTNDTLEISVTDTQKIGGSHYLHIGKVIKGKPKVGMNIKASVTSERRKNILPNHTATHLMHAALREVLGDHVRQAGSLVDADRLRFDYTHFEKPTIKQLKEIEKIVNDKIRENIKLNTTITTFNEAKKAGAMALFGEKYGDEVRMVEVGDFSKELCGGTHVNRTGDIGLFAITQESSVSSGVRRLEAVTGEGAIKYFQNNQSVLSEIEELLSVKGDSIPARVKVLSDANKKLEKKLKTSAVSSKSLELDAWLKSAIEVDGIKLVAKIIKSSSIEEMKQIADKLRDKMDSGVGVLGAEIKGKAQLVVIASKDVIKKYGVSANSIVKELSSMIEGGGGGSDHMATAGGKRPELLDKSIKQAKFVLAKLIKKK